MNEFKQLIYECPEPAIARIWLNRPDAANAQDVAMLYELNAAFDRALDDDDVKIIILAARGKHFSAGHDLKEVDAGPGSISQKRVGVWSGGDAAGAESYYMREKEIYEGFCRRWRDLAKPTIAQVQGKAIAGGLMLIWPMDFVIASDDASFQDNTMFMGIPGVEYFAHVWELGMRRAKEFLLAGQPLSAPDALQAGMVNRVVPRANLEEETLKFARSIADKPAFALKLAKDALNAAFSAQGFDNVQRNAFNAHHLAHTHYRLSQDGSFIDREFMNSFKSRK
ncbi:MAG: enoyl-CoA hydratase [Bermanella sp.]|jgi:enoyl-CoA hydratase